jgi:hypothetical protein
LYFLDKPGSGHSGVSVKVFLPRLLLQTLESTKNLHAIGEVSYSKTVLLQDSGCIVSPLPNTGFWLHKSRRLQLKYAYVP